MTKVRNLHEGWMSDPEYRAEFEALDEEFTLARALIAARAKAGLTQAEVAERMQTTQSVIGCSAIKEILPVTRVKKQAVSVGWSKPKLVLI